MIRAPSEATGDVGDAPGHRSGGAPEGARSLRRLGVVLCGGASRRMGRDKALLEAGGGASMLERALAVLDEVAPEVVLATGREARYAELGRACVLDAPADAGPLAGLAAGLRFLSDRCAGGERGVLLALACDMPRARSAVFERLVARLRERDADACVLETPAGLEPLYGVYDVRVLPAVERALAAGERRLVAFHGEARVERLAEEELGAGLAGLGVATNVNTEADLAEERRT